MSTEPAVPKKRLPIEIIVALIGLSGVLIPFLVTQVSSFITQEPTITVHNHLALPVLVTVNESSAYTRRIEADSSYTFELLSETEFPAKVEWELIRNRNGNSFIGEPLAGNFSSVDKEKELSITNVIGDRTYFYPKIYNNTGKTCFITVNDGLVIEDIIGYSKDGSIIGITGYYKYAGNSNVTLQCDNVTLWRGEKNNKSGGSIKLKPMSGLSEIRFP